MNQQKHPLEQAGGEIYRYERFEAKGHGLLIAAALLVLALPLAAAMTAAVPEDTAFSDWIYSLMNAADEYGEPVLPMMEIEQAWEIEDTRAQASERLVTRMFNGEEILGYDGRSDTFYCTLGLSDGAEWPQINLTALGAQGVQVAWIDDYTYDWCDEAIEENYRYELLAYTDTQYQYIGVIFTGLPIVTIHADDNEEISWDDVYADIHLAGADKGDSFYSRAIIHRRGGGIQTRTIDKIAYRFELHTLDAHGQDDKRRVSVLGMEPDSDWLLVGAPGDRTTVRNHIGFELWEGWNDGEGVTMLKSEMVEVFVGDMYEGTFQLMQRIDADKELERMGANLNTSICVRKISPGNPTDRPTYYVPANENKKYSYCLELRYAPEHMSAEEAFAVFEPFIAADMEVPEYLSDEEFAEIILTHFDIRSVMEYFLFLHSMSLDEDSVYNNVYMWAMLGEDGVYRYTLSPWDMDSTFKHIDMDHDGQFNEINLDMDMFERMMDLDVGGCRRIAREIWAEKRAGVISDDALYTLIDEKERMINAAGAFLRESETLQGGARKLDLSEMRAVAVNHQYTVEQMIDGFWPLEDTE